MATFTSNSFGLTVIENTLNHFWVSFHPSEFESDGTTFTPFIKGHRIRYGTSTGVYTTTVNTYDESGWEGCTTFPVKNVIAGATYYFQVAGVSHAGVLSAWSAESTSVAKESLPKSTLTEPTWDRTITSVDLPITLSTADEKVKFSGSLAASALQITITASGVELYLGSGFYGDAVNASTITMTGSGYTLIRLANGADSAHVYGFDVAQSNVTTTSITFIEKWRENTGTKIGGGTYVSTTGYCEFADEVSALGLGLAANSLTWPIIYDIDATQTYGNSMYFIRVGRTGFKVIDIAYSVSGGPTGNQYQGFCRDNSAFHAARCVCTFASDTDQVSFFQGWGAADRWIANCTATCNGAGGRPFQNDGEAQRNHFLYCHYICESPNDSVRSNRGFHNRYGSDFVSYYECSSTVSNSSSFSMSLGSRDNSKDVQATDVYVVGGNYSAVTSGVQCTCEGGTDNLRFFEVDFTGDGVTLDLSTLATAPNSYVGFSVYAGSWASSANELDVDSSVTGGFTGVSEVRDSFGAGEITGSTTGLTISSPGSVPAYYDASMILEAPSNVFGTDLFYPPSFQ